MSIGGGMATPVHLGLQGGGAHGAITWGVLDRLLEAQAFSIKAVSGTSAGAMNAAVLADGFAAGGAEGARGALRDFWQAVAKAARLSPMRRGVWDRLAGRYSLDRSPGYLAMEGLARLFSPAELNPMGLNPLRDLVGRHVDFERLNRGDIAVHVTATNVRTGLPRVFGPGEITIDAVMASACLPQMYSAIEIDGEAYWDGGFVANPALLPLVENEDARDILIVQINPLVRSELPRRARDILNRVNEISFNASLMKELAALRLIERLAASHGIALRKDGPLCLHLIHGVDGMEDLSASSKLNAEWAYLKHLCSRGRDWAEAWLSEHQADVGVRSSLDLNALLGPERKPPRSGKPRRRWRDLLRLSWR